MTEATTSKFKGIADQLPEPNPRWKQNTGTKKTKDTPI